MFEPSLVTEAYASTVSAPTSVDMNTVMAFIGTVVTGIVVGIGTLLYRKSPNGERPADPPEIHDAKVFFQGPFQQIIDRLNTLILTLEGVVGQNTGLKEAFADTLRTTRHDLKGVLQIMSQDSERDAEEIKKLQRDMANVIGRLDEFLRARVK